ncbi:MAG: glycosyl transferase group 1 [Rhodocyclales bacterium]|nr:glycosyl transferase group 1 [Rhodocyclales bacterium]
MDSNVATVSEEIPDSIADVTADTNAPLSPAQTGASLASQLLLPRLLPAQAPASPSRAFASSPSRLPHVVDVTMFWANESGGVKRYLLSKQAYFERTARWKHSIVIPGALGVEPPGIPGIPIPFSSGYRIPLTARSSRKVMLQMAPDIIESGDPYQLAWAALDSGERMNVPVVAFYHSDLPELAARVFGANARRPAMAYARKLYPRFDAVFAPSVNTLERLGELGVRNALLQPLGVDTTVFHPSCKDESWRSEMGIDADVTVLLYVGRFAPEKNLDVLVEAVRQLGDRYALVAMGAGPMVPSGPGVLAVPYEADTHRLARAMASADMLVHAGNQETFGLVALEAMACGIPVVACAEGGLGELVDASVGYSIRTCAAAQFAEAIRGIADRDLPALRQAARQRAKGYDWRVVLPGLEAHYRRIIGVSQSRQGTGQSRAA